MPNSARGNSIQVIDIGTGKDVLLTAVDWTGAEKRSAIQQIARLVGAPAAVADGFAAELVSNRPRRRPKRSTS